MICRNVCGGILGVDENVRNGYDNLLSRSYPILFKNHIISYITQKLIFCFSTFNYSN